MVLYMARWKGKVAVVTGASSGIGSAIVEQLVDFGLKVVGIARRKEQVEKLSKQLEGKSGKLYAVKADVTKEDEILQAFKWIKNNLGPVHVLVNSAGLLLDTTLMEGDVEQWKKVLDTNVLGLCIATREALKDMRINNVDGHIIHINSVSGHYVPNLPNINVYPASKHAVTALTETLRQELTEIGSKIKVTSISPGYVGTNFLEAVGAVLDPERLEFLKNRPALKAEDVADAVSYVLGTPPHVQVHEVIIRPL